MRNFTPSNSSIRGPRLAHKAGLFCPPAKGEICAYKRRPAITEPLREVTPAKVDCWTAVAGGPLFCPPTNVQQFHVPRNSYTIRPPKAGPNSAGNKPAAAGYVHSRSLAEKAAFIQLSYLFSVP